MNNDDTAVLLSRRISAEEPSFTLDAGLAIEHGRRIRSVRRRRFGFAVAGSAVACSALVGAIATLGVGSFSNQNTSDINVTATAPPDYDAETMPQTLAAIASEYLGDSLTGMDTEFTALADSQTTALPVGKYDQATSMELSYTRGDDHYISVWVAHARGEAEGDPEDGCRTLQAYAPRAVPACDVSFLAGTPVITMTSIHAPMTGTPRQAMFASLPLADTQAITAQGPDLYFARSVKVIRSETLVTSVREVVRARNLAEAEVMFVANVNTLTKWATDPRLVIPAP